MTTPASVFRLDQALAAARDGAQIVARFYTELRDSGLDRKIALALTAEAVRSMVTTSVMASMAKAAR